MKLKKVFVSCCVATVIGFSSCEKDDNRELNTTDRNFMLMASIGNSAEIDVANLAITKATNPAVMAFAHTMLAEHSTAQTELKNLGTNVEFAVKDTIDPAHVIIREQLTAFSGSEFDSAYMHNQLLDHQTSVSNYQMEQNSGQHREVRNYADRYLPKIQMHRERADSILEAFFEH